MRRSTSASQAIPSRGDQHRGEAATDPDLSAPAIDLARTNIGPPGNLGDHRARRQALGNNRPLLLGAPPAAPLRAGNDFQPLHCTVSSTSANTVTCTSAYQPDPPTLRKAAFTGRVRKRPPDGARGATLQELARSYNVSRATI